MLVKNFTKHFIVITLFCFIQTLLPAFNFSVVGGGNIEESSFTNELSEQTPLGTTESKFLEQTYITESLDFSLYEAWIEYDEALSAFENQAVVNDSSQKEKLEATKNKFLGQLELEKQSKTYNISNSIYGIQNQLNSMEIACKNHDSKELSRLITAFYISKGLVYQKSGFVFTQLIVVMGVLLLVVMALLFFYRITYARRIEIEKILKATNKGQEEERRRISLELHDSVAQQMRYVSILAEKISDKDLATEIKQNQSECIENIRNACYTLSSINIDKGSFKSVLKNAMDNFQKRTKINTSLVITPDTDFNLIPQSSFHHIFRIIWELLTNIEKHSGASEVVVLIRKPQPSDKIQNGLMIFISDDGQGIDEKTLETLNSKRIENAKNLHFGLQNIKLRLNEINGTIKYYSEKGEGTEVKLCIKN